jgi:plastocyanin
MKKTILALSLLAGCLPLAAGDLHGKVVCKGGPDCTNAVVYVGAIVGKTFPAPKEHLKMDQKSELFVPHVLAVQQGATVDFHNSDDQLHNVFSPQACAEMFDLGVWPKGEIRKYTYKRECAVNLLCKLHPKMQGFVIVVPTPYFAMVKPDGSYRIPDVPDGTYTVKIWHEKLRQSHKTVTVAGPTEAPLEITP